ncbi:hypothetical protein CR970_02835 [Candidatus Saccharibacteria bacterium]|nr:MAG: hypothetical protein CR970_02835 [Candidatus Saccharibacteria bacterium]
MLKDKTRAKRFLLLVVPIAAILSILTLTKAATPVVHDEVESGSLGGSASTFQDSNASGNAAVRFGGSQQSQKLTWAPPAGWQSYTSVTVPSNGGTLDLNPNTNYRLSASGPITGPLHLRGGRNVVWIGGHISINNKPSTASGTQRRAIVISDSNSGSSTDGRVVFIEGLRIDGNDLAEGINTNAPSAHVILQNIGGGTIKLRGFDDRDGTGKYSGASHPDWVQVWGGAKSVKIDGLTGRSNYQGLFLSATSQSRPDIWLKRVNLEAVELPDEYGNGVRIAGHSLMTWFGNRIGQIRVDNGSVWFKHHPHSGWDGQGHNFKKTAYRSGNGSVHMDPVGGNAPFADNVRAGRSYPTTGPSPYHRPAISSDGTGTYASWPSSATLSDGRRAVTNWQGSGDARIYAGNAPSGDYVPLDSVGIGYTSPGYQ